MPTLRPTTSGRGGARAALAGAALLALLAGACGDDDDTSSSAPDTTTTVAAQSTEPAGDPPATDPPTDTTTTSASPDAADADADAGPSPDAELADAALLLAEEVGEGWVSNGTALVFPMGVDLAADVASCAPFLDTVFEGGNDGVWSSTSYSRNIDVALSSVTVFPTEEGAIAMVEAMASDEFDPCWEEFSELAVQTLVGADSVNYRPVDPPDNLLSGDGSALNALVGTIVLGGSPIPDSCVCSAQQVGRGVVIFDAAEPAFSAAARRDVLARAAERLGETLG